MPRKSYTSAFKLQAVEYAKQHTNRAAGRQFNVDESMVRRWRSVEDRLKLTKRSKRANRGQKARWPQLENELEQWILEQRNQHRGVSTTQIRLKAKQIAESVGIPNFKACPSWCTRFLVRKQLSIRARTTLCQQLPADFEEKLCSFRIFCKSKIDEYKISADQVVNMDEVPLTFDLPMSRTVERCGQSSVSIKTTGHEKSSFTCVLSCTAAGMMLPPMLIFKRKTMPKEVFPKGVVVKVNEKGWMDNLLMKQWIQECFMQRRGGYLYQGKTLLVMDSMRAHITDEVGNILKQLNAIPAVIPGGMTKLLQPLDISVNRPFKQHMRAKWELWMTSGEKSFTATGRLRRATMAQVTSWVDESCKSVQMECMVNGFKKAEIFYGKDVDDLDDGGDISDEEVDEEFISDEERLDEQIEDGAVENPNMQQIRDEQIEDVAVEDPNMQQIREQIANLFHSESENEDFDGFADE